jgi:predicted metal-dependent HD superfamily phosphohydrolase
MTMGRVTVLLERWRAACRGAGATAPGPAIDAVEGSLRRRWSEPHRHYHDVAHLTAVLDVIDAHAHAARVPDRVRLAAWWHDAVYDPRATGDANERASAELAGRVLGALGVPTNEIVRLVLVTAGHDPAPGDADGALLCDADLAVLARPPAEYDAYAAAVRREYPHVPDDAFRAGRVAVLRRLLALPQLYRVPELHAAWEPRARANLSRELDARASGGAVPTP